jgi:hypothetical protein
MRVGMSIYWVDVMLAGPAVKVMWTQNGQSYEVTAPSRDEALVKARSLSRRLNMVPLEGNE